jgi:hypothetical protein
MARILYVVGMLAMVSSAVWLYEVLRTSGAFERNLEYLMMIGRSAAVPLSAMLGGVLITAFGVLLARLKAIQYASELSADALAEIAGRDRGRAITDSSPRPFPSASSSASSEGGTKSPGERETRAAVPSTKTNEVKSSADTPSSATKSIVEREEPAQPSDRAAGQTHEAAAALDATMAAIKEATASNSPVRAKATPTRRDGSSTAKPPPSLDEIRAALKSSRNVSQPDTPRRHALAAG